MEFGIFIQGLVPGANAHDPVKEHEALMNEAALVGVADRNNWKYVWVTEHHALTEYSHISANDVFMGYLAHGTKRIHLGSGIFNLSPRVNHPVRNAERVAMLDHLTETWKAVGVTFRIHGRETRPQMLQVTGPNEIVIRLGFTVGWLR